MTDPITQWNRMAAPNSVERLAAERAKNADKADKAADAPAARPPAQAGDQLELSAAARTASAEPEFDRAKVEAIKRQVQEGNYPLDPRRIAESFASLEQMISD